MDGIKGSGVRWPGSVTFGSYHDPEEEEQGRAADGPRLRDVT